MTAAADENAAGVVMMDDGRVVVMMQYDDRAAISLDQRYLNFLLQCMKFPSMTGSKKC